MNKISTKLRSNALYIVLPLCYFAVTSVILLSVESMWISPLKWELLFVSLYIRMSIMFIGLGLLHALLLAK